MAQWVKNPPAMQYLGQEGPLEEGMATHSSILAWKIPWTEHVRWWSTVLHNLPDSRRGVHGCRSIRAPVLRAADQG